MSESAQDLQSLKKGSDLELGSDTDSTRYGSLSSIRTAELAALEQNIDHEVPQGRHLGLFSTIVLFVSRIVGSGIFATPSSIFSGCGGSPALFLGIWCAAALMAFAGLYLFLEFGCLIPRSGGRKYFLEAAYTKPAGMMSITFSTFTVLMGMAVSNAIIFGKYFLYGIGFDEEFVNQNSGACNYIGALLVLVITLIHGTSLRSGIFIQNSLGFLKLFFIFVMSCTGVYALFVYDASETSSYVADGSLAHMWKAQERISISSVTTAFIQAFFCFAGWDTVHSVTSEIKNPVKTLKVAGPLSLGIALLCYLSLNVAYLKVLDYDGFKAAGPLAGSLLFSKLFGPTWGRKFITLGIALSAGSNLFVVIYSVSRMNQECFREGFLPFSKFMASNKPWGAPLPSLLLCGLLTTIWLVLLPSSSTAFSYLVSMEGYANQLIILLVAVGLFIYRRRHPEKIAEIRAPTFGVVGLIIVSSYLLLGPFFGGQSEATVHFMPPYHIMAICLIGSCCMFWWVKFVFLPYILGYRLKREVLILDDGLVMAEWHKEYENNLLIR